MDDEKYKEYLVDSIAVLKEQAMEAKRRADSPQREQDSYRQGQLMGYYSVITLLKQEAFVLNMDEKEIGLADIDPEVDLLGLQRNFDIDLEQDL